MKTISKKTVLFLCLVCVMYFPIHAQLTGPVSISVSAAASAKELLAAKEARRYLYLRTNSLIDIKTQNWSNIPVNENVILIGSLTSITVQQFLTAKSIASPTLGLEGFYLRTITDGTRKVTLVTGVDETATLRGVYKLMEKFGIRYSQDGDIVAEGTITLDFPAIDKVHTPNFEVRGLLPYHSWNPEGPEYWSAEYYKSFVTQQFKMGQNLIGLVHDYTVSDTRAWNWSPSVADNKENLQYEMSINVPAAGAGQVFPAGGILASPRRLEARKITNLTQRAAYMKQANLDFLKDIYGYANAIGMKTAYGSEHSGDINYYLQFFNNLKTFKPDYYWLMTKEYWTWNSGSVTDQDFIWIKEGLTHAINAKAQTGAEFRIGTTGWRLGPPLSAGGQTAISNHLPADAFISCQTPSVGRDPIQPEWAQITKQKDKWIIPWLQDDFSVANQQLWVDRTITQAKAGKSYGCNGLLGVHWTTKEITPQVMVTAQLGWDATITKNAFWDDFCLINFGSEVASATATIFKNQDGNMARVTNWINNWPGTLASGGYNFAYVDQFAALRPSVVGASNLERFDYYLNMFKYNRALGALANNQGNTTLYRDVMNVLLPATYTPGEIGHIITLARQGSLGSGVGTNYTGTPHLVVLTPRTSLLPTEDLTLEIYFVESGTPQKLELLWKPLGGSSFTTVTAVRQTNQNHFKVNIPASTLGGSDFEYYIKGTTGAGAVHVAPKSAPTRNFTVVEMGNIVSGGSTNVFEAENNFTVVTETGANGSIVPANSVAASNGKFLSLYDIGDKARILFTVPAAGDYNINVKLRAGQTGSSTTNIDNKHYQLVIDGTAATYSTVAGTLSAIDVDTYWATVQTESRTLTAGVHTLDISALSAWLKVDYVQPILTPDTQKPTTPTNLQNSITTTTGCRLTWNASTDNIGVTGYDIFKGATLLGTSSTTAFDVTGLAPGSTSSITVVAKDGAGNVSASSSALSVTTKDADVLINKTTTAPVIDGVKDAIWGNEQQTIGNVMVGSVTSASDLSASWTALWDNANLYVLVEVKDESIKIESGTSWWDDDRVEVFIDAAFSRSTSYGAKQYQYYVRPTETTIKEIKLNAIANTQLSYAATIGGYNIELKIPFATLGITAITDLKLGIDVQVGDDDDGGSIDAKAAWYATSDNSWQNPSLLGVAKLSSGVSGLNDNYLNNIITIYPNPATSKLTISNVPSGSIISFMQIDGRIISTSNANGPTVDCNLSNMAKGIYLVKVQQGNDMTVRRFVIQ